MELELARTKEVFTFISRFAGLPEPRVVTHQGYPVLQVVPGLVISKNSKRRGVGRYTVSILPVEGKDDSDEFDDFDKALEAALQCYFDNLITNAIDDTPAGEPIWAQGTSNTAH